MFIPGNMADTYTQLFLLFYHYMHHAADVHIASIYDCMNSFILLLVDRQYIYDGYGAVYILVHGMEYCRNQQFDAKSAAF